MGTSNEAFDDLDQLDAMLKGQSVPTAAQTAERKASVDWALKLISDFDKNPKGGVWPNLHRHTVANGLVARVQDPMKINQGPTNLCGITSVVRDWAKDSPVDYAWCGICLFNDGVGRLGKGNMLGETLRPTAELKRSSVPDGMPEADWLVLASVHETLVKKYGHAAQDVLGIRYYEKDEGIFNYKAWQNPSEVVAAFKATGYKNVIDNTSPTSHKGINDLEKANDLLKSGYQVSLLINMRMLQDSTFGTTAKLVSSSDHWVGMVEPINVAGDVTFAFNVFSWGKSVRVPNDLSKKTVATNELLINFYGYVAGRMY